MADRCKSLLIGDVSVGDRWMPDKFQNNTAKILPAVLPRHSAIYNTFSPKDQSHYVYVNTSSNPLHIE